MPVKKILLEHGSGGKLMRDLVKGLLLKKLDNPILKELSDSALINYKPALAFTTDSFVVSPLFFPGGDIGKLAVCGTVNDLVVVGARPEYLSLALIIEEGLDYEILKKIVNSLKENAKNAGIDFVTGDLKVVEKGSADKIFINTSGIGRIITTKILSLKNIIPGDKIIISGNIAQHGLAILTRRKDLNLGFSIESDCSALNSLVLPVLRKTAAIKFMRDPTRGGVAGTLNEIAESTGLGIIIEEKNLPISSKVRAAAELLGIDPLYMANEGKVILVANKNGAEKVLRLLRAHPLGCHAREIGSVVKEPKAKVILNTILGTERIINLPTRDPLPRIC